MNYEESINKLFALHQFGIKLGLDNIKKLLSHIGNPEQKLKTFHVAGSNGKGSTASFIASILTEAEYKIGLYTSPHFVKFNERIRINGCQIPDSFVVKFMNENIDYIENESPTFFELTTALAFLYFAEECVDYAVIETGLGGRLDATNVLNSMASVFTSISFEHTNILGNDLISIAKEKAAIIKNNQKVFIGKLPDNAKKIIVAEGKKNNCEIYDLSYYLEANDDNEKLIFKNKTIPLDNIPLQGEYQKYNAALALLTVISTIPNIGSATAKRGLRNVIQNTGIQGRYEVYNKNPKIIFDAAHNFEGIEAFLSAFGKEKAKFDKTILIYGAMSDKNVTEIVKMFPKFFDEIFATEIEYERSLSIKKLITVGKENGVKILPLKYPATYITSFIHQKSNSGKALVVLGSIYVLGKIKSEL